MLGSLLQKRRSTKIKKSKIQNGLVPLWGGRDRGGSRPHALLYAAVGSMQNMHRVSYNILCINYMAYYVNNLAFVLSLTWVSIPIPFPFDCPLAYAILSLMLILDLELVNLIPCFANQSVKAFCSDL